MKMNIIKFEENGILKKDEANIKEGLKGRVRIYDTTGLDGEVLVRDELGDPILEKDNLIVLRGRTFALEKLFEDPIDTSNISDVPSSYQENLDRKIVLFSCGNGGADESSLFEPYTPSYDDTNINSPIPFVTVWDETVPSEYDDNNSHMTATEFENQDLQNVYYNSEINDDGGEEYYSKKFSVTPPEWSYDFSGNEVFKRLILDIDLRDFRGYYVNEICLNFAQYDSSGNHYIDIEAFSKINFDAESFDNTTKTLTVEYIIYA